MKLIARIIAKSAIFIFILCGLIYYSNNRLKSVDDELKELLRRNNYEIKFSDRKLKFRLFNNRVSFYNIQINSLDKDENLDNLKVDEINCDISLFSLIFLGGRSENILLKNPVLSLYHNSSISEKKVSIIEILKYLRYFDNTRLEITRGKIIKFNDKLLEAKEFNEIGGYLLSKKDNLDFNLSLNDDEVVFNISGILKENSTNNYFFDALVNNQYEKLSLKLDVSSDKDDNIKELKGNLKADGKNLARLLEVFCVQCSKQNNFSENSFEMNGLINFTEGDNILKINDISYKDNDSAIKANISFNTKDNNLIINANSKEFILLDDSEKLNIFEIKDHVIGNQSNILDSLVHYFEFLNNFKFDLKLSIERVKLFKDFISKFNIHLSSIDGNIKIDELSGKLNDTYNISSSGKIENNGFRNKLDLETTIPFNSLDYLKFKLSAIPGSISLENIDILSNSFKTKGKLSMRLNEESNDLSGILNVSGINIEDVIQVIKKLIQNKNEDKGGVLANLLVILNKINFSTTIKLNLKDSKLYDKKIESILMNFDIDDKRILLESFLKDKNLFNLKNRIELFWDQLKPKFILKLDGDFIDLNKIKEVSKINEYERYFILTEQEFRKNNDSFLWNDFPIDLSSMLNVNFKILSNITNIVNKNIKIDELNFDATSQSNLMRINNLGVKVDTGVLNSTGNIDLGNQVIFGIFSAKNFNTNSFKEKADKAPTYFSASGKFSSSGNSFRRIISGLSANINYIVQSFKLKNLDVDLFVNNIHRLTDYSSLVSLSERSVVSGETILNEVNGAINIKDNVMQNNFQFSSNRFTGAGMVNSLMQSLVFKGLTRIAFIPYQWNSPVYADIDWSGNLFNTNKSFNIEKLSNIVSKQ